MLYWGYRIGTMIHPYSNMAGKNPVFFRISPAFFGHVINSVKEQTTDFIICMTRQGT